MKKMSPNISKLTKISIYCNTLLKIVRGFMRKPFFKSTQGLLFIGKGVTLLNARQISIGKNVKFEHHAEIQGLSEDGVIMKDNVTIGAYTMIRPSSYYGIDQGKGLSIGHNSSIGPFSYIGCAGKITIGDNVMIGPKASIFAENHIFTDKKATIKSQGVTNQGVIIEDNCWIGSNTIILDGVKIGTGSVIAAGCIITKDIPPYSKVIDKCNKTIIPR